MLTGIPGASRSAVFERLWEICCPLDNSGPPALSVAPLPALLSLLPNRHLLAFDPYLPQNSIPVLLACFLKIAYVALWLAYLCPQFICVLNVTISFLLKAEPHTVVVSFPVAMIKSLTKAI